MKYILVILVLSGCVVPCLPQSIEEALASMPLRDKAIMLIDILMKNPFLFEKFEKILLAAMPLFTNIGIRPEINRFLLPWILDEIPVLLKNEEFLEVVHVLVNEVNDVNITGLNNTEEFAFMDGYLERFDLLHVGIREADVLFEPVFTSRNLSRKYYDIVIPYVMSLLEEFLNIYGEKVLRIVINEINSVNVTGLFNTTDTHIVRKLRSIATSVTHDSANDDFINRINVFSMIKNSLLQMGPSIAPVLEGYGLKPQLIAPVMHGVLDFSEELVKTKLPGLLKSTFSEMNKVNITVLHSLNDSEQFQQLTSVAAPRLLTEVASVSGFSDFSELIGIAKKMLLQKTAREYFPKTSAEEQLTDHCYNDTMSLVDSLLQHIDHLQPEKSWSIKMVDAFGKPSPGILSGDLNFVGSYDECMSLKYTVHDDKTGSQLSGKYCRATFGMSPGMVGMVEDLVGKIDTHGVPLTLTLGLCLPDSCHSKDIEDILHLGPLRSFNLSPKSIVCDEDKDLTKDSDVLIVICVVAIVAILVVIASVVHVFVLNRDQEVELRKFTPEVNKAYDEEMTEMETTFKDSLKQNGGPTENGGPIQNGGAVKECDSITSNTSELSEPVYEGFIPSVVKSFSLFYNVPAVLSFDKNETDINCIHGIRFLSIAWIILGNSFLYTTISISDSPVTGNLLDSLKYLNLFTFQAVLASPYAIDTFFTISGCLICYRSLTKSAAGKMNAFSSSIGLLIRKYIRITPVYIIVMMCYVCMYMYTGSGPMWPQQLDLADKCKTTWWHNILYINNIFGTEGNNPFQQCMPWSWFLACLMQFYLITPILFVFFSMSHRLGVVLVTILMSAGIVSTGIKQHHYGGSILSSTEDNGNYWNNVFITPWCRVAAYCVGLLLGFLMYWKKKIQLRKIYVFLGWFVSIGVLVSLVYCQYSQNRVGGYKWTSLQTEVYEAIGRPLWAAAVAWIILTCHNDQGGFVNTILSWNGFLPLSRLSFVAYLVHPVLIAQFVYSKRTLVYMNTLEMIYMFLGHVLLSFGAALIFSVIFEKPFIGLERIIRKKKWSK